MIYFWVGRLFSLRPWCTSPFAGCAPGANPSLKANLHTDTDLAVVGRCAGGACGHFGKEGEGAAGLILFNSKDGQFDYSVMELLPCLLLGIIGGCGGNAPQPSLHCMCTSPSLQPRTDWSRRPLHPHQHSDMYLAQRLPKRTLTLARDPKPNPNPTKKGKRKVFEAAMVALITATLSYCLPLAFSCSPCPAASTLPEGTPEVPPT